MEKIYSQQVITFSDITQTVCDTQTPRNKDKDKDKDKDKVLKRPNMCYIFEKDMTPRISNMMMVGESVMHH